MGSCSAKRNLSSVNHRSQKETEDRFEPKSVETDSTKRLSEAEIKMPASVDVSEYEPEYIRKAKRGKAKAKERELRGNMVNFSKKYLGVPYKYAGKKPSTGFDCSGFTCYIYQEFGLKLSAASRYQANDGKKIALQKVEPGDLVIFGSKGKVNHVAMVVENKKDGIYVIHSTSRGVVIDNLMKSSYWKPRIMYARRVIGIK